MPAPVVPPDAPAHLRPFLAAGCVPFPGAREPALDCRGAPAVRALGCLLDLLFFPPRNAAFRHPTATCRYDPHDRAQPPDDGPRGVVGEGCRLPIYRRYLIARPEGFTLVRTAADLARAIGPVDTEPAALAFATAVTRGEPRDAIPEGRTPIALRFEPTRVDRVDGGFEVRLFEDRYCGCGPHATVATRVGVARDGTVTTRVEGPVYHDGNRACID